MFIIWGRSNWIKKRGVIGGQCPLCGRIGMLELTQHYSYAHVYFIPMERSRLMATLLVCSHCGSKSETVAEAYAQILPEKKASSLSLGELLHLTNPRFAEQIAYRARLEREVKEIKFLPPGAPDPRVKLALCKLADLDPRNPRVIDCQADLAHWGQLDAVSQHRVLAAVDELEGGKKRYEDSAGFVNRMAKQCKIDAGLVLASLVFALIVCGGCFVTVLWSIFADEWLMVFMGGLGLSGVAALACAVLTRRWLQRRAHRRFFRTVFLPEAERSGVDVPLSIDILRQVNIEDEGIDARLRGLAAAVPILMKVLAEQSGEMPSREWANEIAND